MSMLNKLIDNLTDTDKALALKIIEVLKPADGPQSINLVICVLEELLDQSVAAKVWHRDSLEGIEILQDMLRAVNYAIFEKRLEERLKKQIDDIRRSN